MLSVIDPFQSADDGMRGFFFHLPPFSMMVNFFDSIYLCSSSNEPKILLIDFTEMQVLASEKVSAQATILKKSESPGLFVLGNQ